MKFSVFQQSRKGGRKKNEDRVGYSYTRDAGAFILADGMGGHPQGEMASQIALQEVSNYFQESAKPLVHETQDFLSGCVMRAHHAIIRYASDKGMLDTPRTTLVTVLLQNGRAQWVHCGDSRMYLVRRGKLLTRTRDHSYAEAQERAGAPTENVNRNVLFTCLGSTLRPMFDVSQPMTLEYGDKILLCSDGLWGSVPDDEIVRVLAAHPVTQAVPLLIETALQKAGDSSDNVSVLAVEWESTGADRAAGLTETGRMGVDEFASTIQMGEGAGTDSVDDLDEAAIERSIAEINEAIQRTAIKKR